MTAPTQPVTCRFFDDDGATQATLNLVLLRAPPPVVIEPVMEVLP